MALKEEDSWVVGSQWLLLRAGMTGRSEHETSMAAISQVTSPSMALIVCLFKQILWHARKFLSSSKAIA